MQALGIRMHKLLRRLDPMVFNKCLEVIDQNSHNLGDARFYYRAKEQC